MKNVKRHRLVIYDFIILSLGFFLSFLIISPDFTFPVNDDYAYLATVQNLHETGNYRPKDHIAMTFVAQAYAGKLFADTFGFSYCNMRILTLIISLIGVFFVYLFALNLNLNRNLRLFISFLIMFNLAFLQNAYSFMTDIYSFTFTIIALFYFYKMIENRKGVYWLLGFIFMLLSIFTRQNGLFIGLVFGLVYSIKYPLNLKNGLIAWSPFITSLLLYKIYNTYLDIYDIKPYFYNYQGKGSPLTISYIIKQVTSNFTFSFLYIGLYSLPLLIWFFNPRRFKISKKGIGIFILIMVPVTITLYFKGHLMPFNKYGLQAVGQLGPFTFGGIDTMKINLFYIVVINLFTLLSVVLIVYYIDIFSKFKKLDLLNIKIPYHTLFLFLSGLLSLVPLFLFSMADRYFILPLATLSLGFVSLFDTKDFKGYYLQYVSITLLFVYSLFSIFQVHDYMRWNMAKWEAIDFLLEEKKVNPIYVYGGLEFFAIYNKRLIMDHEILFAYKDFKYTVSLSKKEAHTTLKTVPFHTIFPMAENKFYVEKR